MCPICRITHGGGSPIANRIDANVRRRLCGVRARAAAPSRPRRARCSPPDRRQQHAAAHVAHALALARRRAEHERRRRQVARARPQRQQLVAQHRQDPDLPHAGLGLGLSDHDLAARQVDVAPRQRQGLRDPQPGEHERREQRAPLAASAAAGVDPARRVEQRRDVVGAVDVAAARLRPQASRRRRPFATLRGTSSYSNATSRIAASVVSVLLIDVALSGRIRRPSRSRSGLPFAIAARRAPPPGPSPAGSGRRPRP